MWIAIRAQGEAVEQTLGGDQGEDWVAAFTAERFGESRLWEIAGGVKSDRHSSGIGVDHSVRRDGQVTGRPVDADAEFAAPATGLGEPIRGGFHSAEDRCSRESVTGSGRGHCLDFIKRRVRRRSLILERAARYPKERALHVSATSSCSKNLLRRLQNKTLVKVPFWKRTNGNLTLSITSDYDPQTGKLVGYPFGSIPRLLMFWLTTEALRTGSPRLELGKTYGNFLRDLGLDPNTGGGKRGDAHPFGPKYEGFLRLESPSFKIIKGTPRPGDGRRSARSNEHRKKVPPVVGPKAARPG